MESVELYEKTQEAIRILYQNKEIEGLKAVQMLLPEYQSLLQELLAEGNQEEVLLFFGRLKELVRCFQEQNMIGMADCLDELAEWGK